MPCFHFRNHTQSNPLIRKHAPYLVKKHLNVHSIYYNISFVIQKRFWKLSSLLHNLSYLSLSDSFLLLVLSTFPVFFKSFKNYIFQMSCRILVFYNELYYVVFQSFFFASSSFPRFSWARFFRVQAFLYGSRAQVQGLNPGVRSSRCKTTLL